MTRNKGCSQTLYASASIWSNYEMWVTPSPQEAIWLFLLSPRANERDASLGNTCCPQSPALSRGHQRLSCCCCRCVSRTGSSGGRVPVWAGSRECAASRQQEGATTQIQPTVPELPFGNCFIISKRKLSAAHTTDLSYYRTGHRNLNNSQIKEGFPPPILCHSKHVRSLDSKLL